MNNKLQSRTLWDLSGALSLATLSIGVFGLSGCTMNLPPSNEPIPTADPILLPDKAATNGNSGSTPATSTNSKGQTKPTEIAAPETTTTNPVTNQAGGNVKVINPPAVRPSKPLKQGQIFYVVKPKDTVFEVMRQTGVHWKEIIKLNNLKAPKYTIFPGQSLRVR